VIRIDWNPSPRQLRQFAWACPVGFTLIGVMLRNVGAREWWWWPATGLALGLVLLAVGLLKPLALRPVYAAALAIALPIGWVVSNLFVAIFFFLLITPLALIFRLIGRDALGLRARRAATQWHARPSSDDPGSYYRQG
jgi:hypothetical protein